MNLNMVADSATVGPLHKEWKLTCFSRASSYSLTFIFKTSIRLHPDATHSHVLSLLTVKHAARPGSTPSSTKNVVTSAHLAEQQGASVLSASPSRTPEPGF